MSGPSPVRKDAPQNISDDVASMAQRTWCLNPMSIRARVVGKELPELNHTSRISD